MLFDLVRAFHDLVIIDHVLGVLVLQQVANPAGILLNQHEGIVDLMGHACGHLAEGRHLAGLQHTGVDMGLLAVGGGQTGNDIARPQEGTHRDQHGTQPHEKQDIDAQTVQRGQAFPHIVHHHQQPGHGIQMHHGRQRLLAAAISRLRRQGHQRDALTQHIGQGDIEMLKDTAVISGIGLQHALLVDQEGITALPGVHALQQAVDGFHIDGGTHDEAFAPLVTQDGDDEVRHITEAHKHVADENAFAQHLGEPGSIDVISITQVERPHIRDVAAIHADDAKVHEGAPALLHDREDTAQTVGIPQFGKVMRKGQRFYLGNTFMQKGIQRPVFTAANGFDTGRDLFIIDGIDAVYAEDPQSHQRQKGKPQMRDEQTAEDASVFPCGRHLLLLG